MTAAAQKYAAKPRRALGKASEFHLAVVGCGPRGLYCLERLTAELDRLRPASSRLSISIFEPCPHLGAGSVYDLSQPDCLRMNFASKHINAWPDGSNDYLKLSLVDWLAKHYPSQSDPDGYVPRRLVGEYLHEAFQITCQQLKRHAAIQIHPEKIKSIEPNGRQWTVCSETRKATAHEVLLTVGHEGWRSVDELGMIPTFPFTRLSEDAIVPGADVSVRGFGLTFIDAALCLTEGREGQFVREYQALDYRSSGREPRRIAPHCRTGRPMLSKPDERLFPQPPELDEIWSRAGQRLAEICRPIDVLSLRRHLWPVITDAAAEALRCFPAGYCTGETISTWFARWCSSEMTGDDALEAMRQSYRVATGQAAPDIPWSLGAAWRGIYPALVELVNHGGMAPTAWPMFRSITTEMERLSFGPPASNAGRILALIEAEIIDLSRLTASTYQPDPPSDRVTRRRSANTPEYKIDAVIPSPHHVNPQGPLQYLEDAGIIQRAPGARGISVDECGAPLNSAKRARGISVLGRATEGCILGNDSLSRSLDPHPESWSRRVVERIRKRVFKHG